VRKTASVLIMKRALTRERRINRPLRAVAQALPRVNGRLKMLVVPDLHAMLERIESLRAEIRDTRHLVDVNVIRLGQVQAELDCLKTPKP
jgi:hypothetical protein